MLTATPLDSPRVDQSINRESNERYVVQPPSQLCVCSDGGRQTFHPWDSPPRKADMSLFVASATVRLTLSPAYLGDVDGGIREQLNASLFQHVAALGGVVVAYGELKQLDGLGCIRGDQPHMHLPVSLRILMFAPRVGDALTGVVRRQGTDHTALLVHGMFSAAVSSARGRSEGEAVRFIVRSLQVTDGLMSIVGESSAASHATPSSPHHRALPSPGGSSPLRVTATRPVTLAEAATFLDRFLEESAAIVHTDVQSHMQTVRDALGEGAADASQVTATAPDEQRRKKKQQKKEAAAAAAAGGAAPAPAPSAAPSHTSTPFINGSGGGGEPSPSTKKKKEKHARGEAELEAKKAKKAKRTQDA